MTLTLKMLPQHFDCVFCWEEPLKLSLRFSLLLLFILGKDFHVDLRQVIKALEEGRDTFLILKFTTLLWRGDLRLALLFG